MAFQRLADLRDAAVFGGWLKRIAARLYLKRFKGRLSLETALDDVDERAADGLEPGLMLDLDQALAKLSSSERVCVSLCHGAGFSHGEISESLNMPLGTVKSHVNRGLARLRTLMGVEQGQGPNA